MRKLFILATSILLFTNISSYATNVGGIISSNTTWDIAGEPVPIV
jgi:hypothetical protein